MSTHSSSVVQENIASVLRFEEEQQQRRPHAERLAATVGSFVGTLAFIVGQIAFVLAWITINTGNLPGVAPFDPYPFSLLSGTVSLEGVLLTAFVLLRQSHMSDQADRRSHLDLQVSLLMEKEVTKIIQMLDRMAEESGTKGQITDAETSELEEVTAVENLARDLHHNLDDRRA